MLIDQVVVNLNAVLGSLGDQSRQFDKAVTSLAGLMERLAARKSDISNSIAYSNAAAGTIADLLQQVRPPFANTVAQSDRTNSIVVRDHDYVDDLLNTLPDAYQALARQGMYGDFFTFYLCDAVLKLNGKGGQPVLREGRKPSYRAVCTEMKSFSERNLTVIGVIGVAATAQSCSGHGSTTSCRYSPRRNTITPPISPNPVGSTPARGYKSRAFR